MLTKRQTFRYREIPRSEIRNAPYNPRVMSDTARKKLRRLLKRHGLVETLVWNERTRHLVGGHQRLQELDDAEGGRDYLVGVAAIDVDELQEKAINVGLNNKQAQGGFDPVKFHALSTGPDAPSLEGMGLTKADLDAEIGSTADVAPDFAEATEAANAIVQELTSIKASRREYIGETVIDPHYDSDYHLTILFPDVPARNAFLERLGLQGDAIPARDLPWRADVRALLDAACQ